MSLVLDQHADPLVVFKVVTFIVNVGEASIRLMHLWALILSLSFVVVVQNAAQKSIILSHCLTQYLRE